MRKKDYKRIIEIYNLNKFNHAKSDPWNTLTDFDYGEVNSVSISDSITRKINLDFLEQLVDQRSNKILDNGEYMPFDVISIEDTGEPDSNAEIRFSKCYEEEFDKWIDYMNQLSMVSEV